MYSILIIFYTITLEYAINIKMNERMNVYMYACRQAGIHVRATARITITTTTITIMNMTDR